MWMRAGKLRRKGHRRRRQVDINRLRAKSLEMHGTKKEKDGNPAALLQAEEQALISGLRAVPKAERHSLREIPTEDAYFDWQLRLAAEQMETAGNKVELLWEKWCGKKAFLEEKMWKESAGDAFWELSEAEKAELEELRESLNEAWDTWNETCLVWQEIWDEWV